MDIELSTGEMILWHLILSVFAAHQNIQYFPMDVYTLLIQALETFFCRESYDDEKEQ